MLKTGGFSPVLPVKTTRFGSGLSLDQATSQLTRLFQSQGKNPEVTWSPNFPLGYGFSGMAHLNRIGGPLHVIVDTLRLRILRYGPPK